MDSYPRYFTPFNYAKVQQELLRQQCAELRQSILEAMEESGGAPIEVEVGTFDDRVVEINDKELQDLGWHVTVEVVFTYRSAS